MPLNDLKRGFEEQRGELVAAVTTVLDSGWYVLGPHHDQFEQQLASYVGAEAAIGVGNGTEALTLAVLATTAGRRGSVVTAANAGGYTTTAVQQIGYTPVYADVDPQTHCLTAATVESLLDASTRAVVVTHLYGRLAELAELVELCDAHDVPLIEDCAQAAGARRGGVEAGVSGAAGTFSFYPTKNLAALGDGGAVVTSDPEVEERLRRLRQYGWHGKYLVGSPDGRNSRLDEVQAAVLSVRLPMLDGWNERRRSIIAAYRHATAEIPGVEVLPAEGPEHAGHLAVAVFDERDAARAALEAAGIRTDVHYPIPDHRQPATSADVRLPVTEVLAERVLSLPCFPQLRDDEVERVSEALDALRRPAA